MKVKLGRQKSEMSIHQLVINCIQKKCSFFTKKWCKNIHTPNMPDWILTVVKSWISNLDNIRREVNRTCFSSFFILHFYFNPDNGNNSISIYPCSSFFHLKIKNNNDHNWIPHFLCFKLVPSAARCLTSKWKICGSTPFTGRSEVVAYQWHLTQLSALHHCSKWAAPLLGSKTTTNWCLGQTSLSISPWKHKTPSNMILSFLS